MLPWPIALLLTTFVVQSSGSSGASIGQSPALFSVVQGELLSYGNDAAEPRSLEKEPNRAFQANLRRRRRYVIRKKRWRHNNLTWRLDRSHVKDEDEFVVRMTLHRAFQQWSSVADVRFREVFEEPADISIGFERGKHEDAFPFDGKDGVVAHAFYPRDGRLHFDADEDWSLNTPVGVNLYQTAVHEIGHILGLEHSMDPRAVMYAAKRPYNPEFALGDDDVRAVRALFPLQDGTTADTKKEQPRTDSSKMLNRNKEMTLSQVVENLIAELSREQLSNSVTYTPLSRNPGNSSAFQINTACNRGRHDR